ncbi:MAG TPA: hypothetical protein VFC84_08055 [Desulfosporosinus sp.]|nr:hypothetical protein [Desulfosporosinus sp.]
MNEQRIKLDSRALSYGGAVYKDVHRCQPSQGPLTPSLAPVTLGRPCPADGLISLAGTPPSHKQALES